MLDLPYGINNQTLKKLNSVKNLGVILTTNSSSMKLWRKHTHLTFLFTEIAVFLNITIPWTDFTTYAEIYWYSRSSSSGPGRKWMFGSRIINKVFAIVMHVYGWNVLGMFWCFQTFTYTLYTHIKGLVVNNAPKYKIPYLKAGVLIEKIALRRRSVIV